ncbi:tRNA pseudouridine 55 synthase [Salmonella bongori]|nr:tRNA pseudouridine 55 synthase [Salmonella bongori]
MSRPRRRGRDIHGVLLLDKPQGMSSNDVLQKVKRIYNANRAGHTGALDPLGDRHVADFASVKRPSFRSICWTQTSVIG